VEYKHSTMEFNAVARVIALGGETITITNNTVFIDKKELAESFKTLPCNEPEQDLNLPCSNFGPFSIPAGEFFVMADNRGESLDNRLLEPHSLSRRQIVGKVVSIVSKRKPD
ncbi:MAG: signal peptidase I, partial [Acidobacteriota bacterium]